MTSSCGCSGLASCHCVCQKVFGSPSTAFAPLPSSPTVSSLSTRTNLSPALDACGTGAAAGATGATVGAVLLVVAVWLAQPAESNRQADRTDAPANIRFIFVFITLRFIMLRFKSVKMFYQAVAAESSAGFRLPAVELREQLAVDAAEAAVAEHHHHVAALRAFGDVCDDGIHVGQICGILAGGFQILHQLFRVQAFLWHELIQSRDFGNHHRIGVGKRRRQFALKNIPARRV